MGVGPAGRRGIRRRGASAMLAAFAIAGCSVLPGREPATVVKDVLTAIAAHDPATVSANVCPARRDPQRLSFGLEGMFEGVDGLSFADTYALVRYDLGGLTVTELSRKEDVAEVAVRGRYAALVDPVEFEARYRADVAAKGEAPDEELLDQNMPLIADGSNEVDIDQRVRVVREDGTWRICELPPTP